MYSDKWLKCILEYLFILPILRVKRNFQEVASMEWIDTTDKIVGIRCNMIELKYRVFRKEM